MFQEREFKRKGKETLETAWQLLNLDGWVLEKSSKYGDTIHSKKHRGVGKIFLLSVSTIFFKMTLCFLYYLLFLIISDVLNHLIIYRQLIILLFGMTYLEWRTDWLNAFIHIYKDFAYINIFTLIFTCLDIFTQSFTYIDIFT